MPATDALFLKNELRDDLTNNSRMTRFLDSFIESFRGKAIGVTTSKIRETFAPGMTGADMAQRLTHWLDASQIFYLDAKMHPLVTAAAESMPAEPLLPQDLPSDQGFLLIPGGIANIDIRGQILKFNAISWSAFGGAVQIFLWSDKNDPQDVTRQQLSSDLHWEIIPRLTLAHVSRIEFGKALPNSLAPNFVVPPDVPIEVKETKHGYAVAFGKGYDDLNERLGDFHIRPDPVLIWLLTCWRLMQQEITTVDEEWPTRQVRRQMARKNRPDVPVSVIRLRRAKNREHGNAEVEWTHRWLRRGHWRQQWYGSGSDRYQRAIWIHPTICGPEDAPLLVREHVYSLER